MPVEGPTLLKLPGNVYPWQPDGNFHVTKNFWTAEPKHLLLEGHLNANAKYLSHPMPVPGRDHGKSTGYGCYFRLPTVTDEFYFIIANQAVLQEADAGIRGYAVHVDGAAPAITIERLDGGSANVVLNNGTYVWTPDTNLHCMYMTRAVSGVNRFFRLYFGDAYNAMAFVIGPTDSDGTYTNFPYWGWDHLTHDRIVVGGEWIRS